MHPLLVGLQIERFRIFQLNCMFPTYIWLFVFTASLDFGPFYRRWDIIPLFIQSHTQILFYNITKAVRKLYMTPLKELLENCGDALTDT